MPLLALVSLACGASSKPPNAEVVAREAFKVDGASLGTPIRALASKYAEPCDIDPIDEKRATLWFWTTGKCREAKPFPERTSLVIVTEGADERGKPDAAMTLIVWAGGTYFDARTNLGVKIGDSLDKARAVLGAETERKTIGDGGLQQVSWRDEVHALVEGVAIVALAIGSLRGGEERKEVLLITLQHHRRYDQKGE